MPAVVMAQAVKPCSKVEGLERQQCLDRTLKAQRAQLDSTLASVYAQIEGAKEVPRLDRAKWKSQAEQAQDVWRQYVKLECNDIRDYFTWGVQGGSGLGNSVRECEYYALDYRINELRRRYKLK